MVEDRPIMSVKYCLPVPSLSLLAKIITHPVVRSLCDQIAEHLVETLAVIGLPVTSCSAVSLIAAYEG